MSHLKLIHLVSAIITLLLLHAPGAAQVGALQGQVFLKNIDGPRLWRFN